MSNWGKGGFIGTDADSWVSRSSNVFDGIWGENEIVTYALKAPAPSWATPGAIPAQAAGFGTVFSGPTSGSVPVPATCPHVYIYIAAGGGGGGCDFDDGGAGPGGSGGTGYALISRSAVSGNVINYTVGGGGGGAGARSNDGGGGSGGNSSVTFGNFTMAANGGGGGCGKCGANAASPGSWGINAGAAVFSGNGGGQSNWLTGIDNTFIPVENAPATSTSIPPVANAGFGNNSGNGGGSGGNGAIYVRFGRGINDLTVPGPGNDYGIPTVGYTVPTAAKTKDNV